MAVGPIRPLGPLSVPSDALSVPSDVLSLPSDAPSGASDASSVPSDAPFGPPDASSVPPDAPFVPSDGASDGGYSDALGAGSWLLVLECGFCLWAVAGRWNGGRGGVGLRAGRVARGCGADWVDYSAGLLQSSLRVADGWGVWQDSDGARGSL